MDLDTNQNSQCKEKNIDVGEQSVRVENTAILECLEVVMSEYKIERDKKQSFETRAGIIMALLGATCGIFFKTIKLNNIIHLFFIPLSFINLIKILSVLFVYGGLIFTIIMVMKTIITKQHNNFNVICIKDELINQQRFESLRNITFAYREIILQHRDLNEKRANAFKNSLYGISTTLIAFIIFNFLN